MIKFACLAPHPPLLLPNVGSGGDRAQVQQTISALAVLAERLVQAKPEQIIISSPHPDWGFKVPFYFLLARRSPESKGGAKDFQGEIKQVLTTMASPQDHFQRGKELAKNLSQEKSIALIASGDLSHCLKEESPYGFQPDGPKFDQALIECLKNKDIQTMLKLDELYPQAGECGLRSFCFVLGALEGAHSLRSGQVSWQADILSYQAPFGVGYLVANLL